MERIAFVVSLDHSSTRRLVSLPLLVGYDIYLSVALMYNNLFVVVFVYQVLEMSSLAEVAEHNEAYYSLL